MRVAVSARDTWHQKTWADAMIAGLQRHGVEVNRIAPPEAPSAEIVCCWGWRNGIRYQETGHRVLVAEAGYIGPRLEHLSLGWDGLNGRATFPEPHYPRALPEPRPWKSGGDYILLIGQVPGDMAVKGVDITRWYAEMAATLAVHGLPVRFRPHPVAVERGQAVTVPGAETIEGVLDDALDGAAWVVTWNSNTGVDAVMRGVPTVTCDRGAMAWEVTGHWPDQVPPTPDRTDWLARMAWCQWTKPEIASGEAWEALQTCL